MSGYAATLSLPLTTSGRKGDRTSDVTTNMTTDVHGFRHHGLSVLCACEGEKVRQQLVEACSLSIMTTIAL